MMKARILTVSLLSLAIGCRDNNPPTRISGPPDPSKIISDGAHGGNKDFFFLPPMVPLPVGNPDFELGQFNNTLKPSLRVDICELKAELVNGAAVLPKATTECVSGAPLKRFAPGSVNLVNLPLKQGGWWTLFNLPPDGFYYVLWDTRQSNLNVKKYYRIKVFVEGAADPLGVADVDPMSSLSQWKYTNTGQVIQLVDDVLLPIPFRVEHGGGSALCGDASLCVSTTISNSSPTGSQIVTVDGGNGAGAVAGVKFPNGWLPASGPQNVVVTISKVDIGTTDPVTGISTKPCHAGLALQQFPGCFNFTTTPHLAAINESGDQFAADVTVAVCYSLQNSGDPREKYAEMYASGPDEPAHALEDASDAGLLSAATRNCSTTPIIGDASSNSATRFARANWRRIKSGVGALFGVKTAYAVDLGLGGITKKFSNVGPAISATIAPVGATDITLTGGGNVQAYVRLTGSDHHDGQHQNSVGLPDLPVHFQLLDANSGAIADVGSDVGTATQIDVVTNSLPIDVESSVSGGGYAAVNWAVPNRPGVYHLAVNGAALGGPVTFNVTVPAGGNGPIDLGTLVGFDNGYAAAVNGLGHAAGYILSPNATVPVIWRDGVIQSIGFADEGYAVITAINDQDMVAGTDRRGTDTYAFRWTNGVRTELPTFLGLSNSTAAAMDSAGEIVGLSWDPTQVRASMHSWMWSGSTVTDLGVPPNAIVFTPHGMNDVGEIVGEADDGAYRNAWVRGVNGSFLKLPGLSFLGTHSANGINDAGIIVGSSSLPLPGGQTKAVRWVGGAVLDLGTLPGDTQSSASAINDHGQIVGVSQNGNSSRAFIWQNGVMTELPSLGGTYTQAVAINANGDVVGVSTTSDGTEHAVRWHVSPPSP